MVMATTPRHRSRPPTYLSNSAGYYIGVVWIWDSAKKAWVYPTNFADWPQYSNYLTGFEECWDETHPGPPYRTGGPLFLRRMNVQDDRQLGYTVYAYLHPGTSEHAAYRYNGGFVLTVPDRITRLEIYERVARCGQFGAQAWRMFSPAKPQCDLSQFWIELRDLKSMFMPVKQSFSGLAGGYLNMEFGWRPFLSDISKVIITLIKLEKTLARLKKYNGRWQRRHGTVQTVSSVSGPDSLGNMILPTLPTYFYPGRAATSCTRLTSIVERVWFEAKVRYYLPELEKPTLYDCTKLLAKIVGLDFTKVSLWWKVFPYSWLADWFGNMTHLIEGMETAMSNDLVASYAYVMEDRFKRVTYDQFQPFTDGTSVHLKTQYELRSKERANANPLGFGPAVDRINITPRQVAILAALGIQGNFGTLF